MYLFIHALNFMAALLNIVEVRARISNYTPQKTRVVVNYPGTNPTLYLLLKEGPGLRGEPVLGIVVFYMLCAEIINGTRSILASGIKYVNPCHADFI